MGTLEDMVHITADMIQRHLMMQNMWWIVGVLKCFH